MPDEQNSYATLKRIILICMILVPFIPFMMVLGIGYYYFAASIEHGAISGMKRTVEDHRQMIDAFLKERLEDLNLIQKTYSFDELTRPSTLKQVFENLGSGSSAFVDLGVFDESGLHVAYQGPYELTGKRYNTAAWFQDVISKGVYISDVFLGYRRIPHFIIATATSANSRRWVIRATIDSKFFNDLVKNVRIGKTGEAYLLNFEGYFQTEQRSGGRLMEKNPNAAEEMQISEGIQPFLAKDISGRTFLYATTQLQNTNWLLVVRQEHRDAFAALRSAAARIFLTSLVGGAAIICAALYLTRFIIGRIQRVDAEKTQLGVQLIHAGRLAEIGEMATGFAHEINNPLQIIKSEHALVEMVMNDLKQRGDLHPSEELVEVEDSLAQIKQQVERCAAITKAILNFGRSSDPVTTRIDIGAFLHEVIEMVAKKTTVHGITIQRRISKNTPPIMGDSGQLQQVLLNLINNAFDAIIESRGNSGGRLTVAADASPEGEAEISVSDNGCGIEPENINRLFTPFFTTKPVGKGTGLGLSVCYGIVTKMGGHLAVESEPGKGTTFIIRFPPADCRMGATRRGSQPSQRREGEIYANDEDIAG